MKHTERFEVRFYEADRASRLTPVSLFNYLQETAIRHGDAVGMDGEALTRLGYMWMMNRLRLRILRPPLRREEVRVETWGSCLHGLFAVREWRATDARGQVVALATGRWVVIDVARKKIVRIPVEMPAAYGEHEARAIDDPFDRMGPISEGGHARRFHVRFSELDTNQHANSASYVDWCLEAVPADILEGYLPFDFEITFKKEAKLGEELTAMSLEDPAAEPGARRFRHLLSRSSDGAVNAIAASVWRPQA
jgi:acyl-ACP thioesterase